MQHSFQRQTEQVQALGCTYTPHRPEVSEQTAASNEKVEENPGPGWHQGKTPQKNM